MWTDNISGLFNGTVQSPPWSFHQKKKKIEAFAIGKVILGPWTRPLPDFMHLWDTASWKGKDSLDLHSASHPWLRNSNWEERCEGRPRGPGKPRFNFPRWSQQNNWLLSTSDESTGEADKLFTQPWGTPCSCGVGIRRSPATRAQRGCSSSVSQDPTISQCILVQLRRGGCFLACPLDKTWSRAIPISPCTPRHPWYTPDASISIHWSCSTTS